MSETKIEEAVQKRPTLRSWLQVRIISSLSLSRGRQRYLEGLRYTVSIRLHRNISILWIFIVTVIKEFVTSYGRNYLKISSNIVRLAWGSKKDGKGWSRIIRLCKTFIIHGINKCNDV